MMKNKKFLTSSIFCLFLLLLFTAGSVSAQGVGTGDSGPIFSNPLKVDSIAGLLAIVLDVVVQIGLVVVVFFIILAGFNFVTARGDFSKITKAKEALIATFIGSAIVLGSYAIAKVLENTVNQLTAGTVSVEIINFKT